MYFNQDYSDRILREVKDIASRVHLLKERLAKQNVSVRLEHYWKLAHVRRTFAEFKRRVEQLEEDDDSQCNRDYERIEATWNKLVRAVDALLATIPVKSLTPRRSSKQSSA
jgi:hypothetical protein